MWVENSAVYFDLFVRMLLREALMPSEYHTKLTNGFIRPGCVTVDDSMYTCHGSKNHLPLILDLHC